MSELTLQDVATRLDDLLKEVRRQGRAAIAAQAAAESCLETLKAQSEEAEDADDADDADDAGAHADAPAPAHEAERWLRALIPVVDAVDRIARQASAPDAPPPAKRSFLERVLARPERVESGAAQAALAEGLRVLRAQLAGALRDLGVETDRRTGAPVDGERQRVVEVRPPRPGELPGTVVEVVRPGYALGGKIIREAEVVIATAGSKS